MESPRPESEETLPSLERAYSFIATVDRYKKQWRDFRKSFLWGLTILAVILVAGSAAILLSNQRYLAIWNAFPLFSNVTRFEFAILVSGFISACFLLVLSSFFFFDFLGKAIQTVGGFLEKTYRRLIAEPLTRSFSASLQWMTETRVWKLPLDLGRMIGYKYFLYPAIPSLEPESDRQTIKSTALEQLPPHAYTDEKYCDATLQRYFTFGQRTVLLFLFVWVGTLFIGYFLLAIILNPVLYVVQFLPAPLDSFVTVGILLAVLGVTMVCWFAFIVGTNMPFIQRRHAWAVCRFQLLRKRELEEQAKGIADGVAEQLQINIEKLRHLYAREYETTQAAMREREQAIRRLKNLVERPDMDEQTLKSLMWLVEFALDKRRREDTIIQEQEGSKARRYDLVKDILIGLIFFALGLVVSR